MIKRLVVGREKILSFYYLKKKDLILDILQK